MATHWKVLICIWVLVGIGVSVRTAQKMQPDYHQSERAK